MPRPKSADAVTREAIRTIRLAIAHLKQMLSQAGLQPELRAELIREMRLNSAKLTRLEAKLRPVGRPAQEPVVPHPVAPAEQRKKVWADFTLEERQGMARFGFDVETGEALPEPEPQRASPAPAVLPVNAPIALAPTVIDELAEITVPAVSGGAVGALEMPAESAAPAAVPNSIPAGPKIYESFPDLFSEIPVVPAAFTAKPVPSSYLEPRMGDEAPRRAPVKQARKSDGFTWGFV